MKNKINFLTVLLLISMSLMGCSKEADVTPSPQNTLGVNMANPASVHCEEQGGTLEIRTEADGSTGYCKFPNGSECEEWAFFRGECTPETAQDAGSSAGAPFLNTEWILESFGAVGTEKATVPGTRISIQFNQEGQIEGSGGCNTYFGSYETGESNALSFGVIGSTEMACLQDGVMDQEQAYLAALGNVTSFALDQNRLQLFYDDGENVINFVK